MGIVYFLSIQIIPINTSQFSSFFEADQKVVTLFNSLSLAYHIKLFRLTDLFAKVSTKLEMKKEKDKSSI